VMLLRAVVALCIFNNPFAKPAFILPVQVSEAKRHSEYAVTLNGCLT
jgi:hypothetical protein